MARGIASSRRVIQGRTSERAVLITHVAGERSEGEFADGTEVEKKVRLSSAPLTIQTLLTLRESLPEGLRLRQARMFWLVTSKTTTARPFRVGNGQTTGDIIRYRKTDYRIVYHTDYSEEGFIEVIGVRPDYNAEPQ